LWITAEHRRGLHYLVLRVISLPPDYLPFELPRSSLLCGVNGHLHLNGLSGHSLPVKNVAL
jgi:hypothetical protein